MNELMNIGLIGKYLTENEFPLHTLFLVFIFGYLLCIILAYLLGSFNFGILISKWIYHDDIRKFGSKNAGMTNMLRTYGKGAAAGTLIGDTLKAVFSVLIGRLIFGIDGAYVAGLFCIIGHVFPLYFHFQGGKGVVTAATMILLLNPLVFLFLFIIFILIVAATKYISLGSIICIMIYPIFLNRMQNLNGMQTRGFPQIIAIMIMLLILFLHRENIKRLLAGTESKVSFKKKK